MVCKWPKRKEMENIIFLRNQNVTYLDDNFLVTSTHLILVLVLQTHNRYSQLLVNTLCTSHSIGVQPSASVQLHSVAEMITKFYSLVSLYSLDILPIIFWNYQDISLSRKGIFMFNLINYKLISTNGQQNSQIQIKETEYNAITSINQIIK